MKIRTCLWAISLGVSALLVSCSKSERKTLGSEPVYKGKPLSYWAVMSQDQALDSQPSAGAVEAIEAVRAIGTNGIPYLIKWLEPPRSSSTLPGGAAESFKVLAPAAKSAIPELGKLLEKYKPPHSVDDYSVWHSASKALSYLGPDALPVLLNAATNIQGQHIQWELIQTGKRGRVQSSPWAASESKGKSCYRGSSRSCMMKIESCGGARHLRLGTSVGKRPLTL